MIVKKNTAKKNIIINSIKRFLILAVTESDKIIRDINREEEEEVEGEAESSII